MLNHIFSNHDACQKVSVSIERSINRMFVLTPYVRPTIFFLLITAIKGYLVKKKANALKLRKAS